MNPRKPLMMTTPRIIAASTHRFSINLAKPAASRTYTRILWNWERNSRNVPRFLPSGKRFGPYFWSRLEASAVPRPVFVLVVSRFITSSALIACQVAAVPTALVLDAVLIMFTPSNRSAVLGPTRGGAILSSARRAVKKPWRLLTRRAHPHQLERA